ncbi:MAG: carbohydrate ABC transporter permease [Defluviitaleaceae bacterium]|nr:carbohydrate ABC transporter permease [Defluviitaleaceae bacterium]
MAQTAQQAPKPGSMSGPTQLKFGATPPKKDRHKGSRSWLSRILGGTGARSNRTVWGNFMMILFLCVMASLFLIPVVMIINNAFKPLHELLIIPPHIFVRNPTLRNFQDLGPIFANTLVPFSRYLFNSLFIVALGCIGQIFFASMAAYPLAKYEFPGVHLINRLIVLSLMFSGAVTAIPNFVIVSALGFIDTYFAVIIPVFAQTLGLYLMRNFMGQVYSSVIESAAIDGAGEFRTLWTVVMPAVKPAWITLIIFSFQSMWGVTGGAFLYNEALKPLNAALGQITAAGLARIGVGSAIGLIMFMVPLVIFIIMQSNVVETMNSSGMKD